MTTGHVELDRLILDGDAWSTRLSDRLPAGQTSRPATRQLGSRERSCSRRHVRRRLASRHSRTSRAVARRAVLSAAPNQSDDPDRAADNGSTDQCPSPPRQTARFRGWLFVCGGRGTCCCSCRRGSVARRGRGRSGWGGRGCDGLSFDDRVCLCLCRCGHGRCLRWCGDRFGLGNRLRLRRCGARSGGSRFSGCGRRRLCLRRRSRRLLLGGLGLGLGLSGCWCTAAGARGGATRAAGGSLTQTAGHTRPAP